MSDNDNVVDFTKRLEKLHEENADLFPTEDDITSFLFVLSFIRKLSISRTGNIKFTEDEVSVTLDHCMDFNEINDFGAEKMSVFRQVASMAFVDDVDGSIEGTAEDLLDCLEELLSWTDEENYSD